MKENIKSSIIGIITSMLIITGATFLGLNTETDLSFNSTLIDIFTTKNLGQILIIFGIFAIGCLYFILNTIKICKKNPVKKIIMFEVILNIISLTGITYFICSNLTYILISVEYFKVLLLLILIFNLIILTINNVLYLIKFRIKKEKKEKVNINKPINKHSKKHA